MKKVLFSLITLLTLNITAWGAEYGMTSYPVLMIDSYSARSRSLANSTVSQPGDINNLVHNPAALSTLDRITLGANRLSWLFETTFNNLQFAMPLPTPGKRSGIMGISLVLMETAAFDATVNGASLASYANSDFSLGLLYANNIFLPFDQELAKKIHLSLGVNVKYVQAVMGSYTANMMALDAGMIYGLALKNLASVFKAKTEGNPDTFWAGFSFRNIAIPLHNQIGTSTLNTPWYFDFGLSYLIFGDVRHQFLLSTALELPSDNDLFFNAGLEYSYKKTIFLRGGYKIIGRTEEGLSFGVGLNFEIADHLAFQVDYAMDIMSSFDDRNTFSVSILF